MFTRMIILSLAIVSLVGCSSSPPNSTSSTSTDTTLAERKPEKPVEIQPEPQRETIEQQKASAQLKQSQQEYELLNQSMIARQKIIADYTTQSNKLDAELSDFNRQVNLYVMDNKMEVLCMGALGMSLDESNQYSKDVKNLATATSLGCGIGVISDGKFAGNVGKVFNQLVRADQQVKSLKQQLNEVRSKLNEETNTFEAEKSKSNALVSEIKR